MNSYEIIVDYIQTLSNESAIPKAVTFDKLNRYDLDISNKLDTTTTSPNLADAMYLPNVLWHRRAVFFSLRPLIPDQLSIASIKKSS
uniref:Uncharacterized protein n=1 Tax=Rhabditophanes sp. KR3021 TaxID=114890 RepID=A0AC35TL63_9BILA